MACSRILIPRDLPRDRLGWAWRLRVALLCLMLWASGGAMAWAFPLTWSLTEFQPNVPNGGRANTIAVHPSSVRTMIVAAETGGLFKTTDSGVTWRHIDSFKPYAMGSVAYLPANPDIVIATAGDGFGQPNQGGIWRSADGGVTWTHIDDPVAPAGSSVRFSAGEISVAPDTGTIYVASSYGVSLSSDQGVTWTPVRPFGSLAAASVLALPGNVVLAGAPWRGVVRSTDGGSTWVPTTAPFSGVADMHAFGRAPSDAALAFVVDQDTRLHVSEDAGATWALIASAPAGGGGCGGIAFIKAVRRNLLASSGLALYAGNRCSVQRLYPPRIAGTARYDYSGTWTTLNSDHGDTRDIAIARVSRTIRPVLLATDGGLHRTADGGANWVFTGGGVNGYNALQITEVKGQQVQDSGRYDLYFGTQDNNVLASTDAGATWPGVLCCEGFFFEMQKEVATAAHAQINFVACAGCGNFFTGAGFSGLSGWANPPGTLVGNPTIITRNLHVQGVAADSGFSLGMAATTDLGAHWRQYAVFSEDRRDIPKLSQRRFLGGRMTLPVQYQSVRVGYDAARGFETSHLLRLSKRLRDVSASVQYPAMNGFGSLGINPTMFAWYQVFGVDPSDSRFLIAPDIVNEKMMQTSDGGENWTEVPGLTSLVTDGGRFNFRSALFPMASAVSFHPRNGNHVAVGTHQNGIMVSTDRGAHWEKVPGSERAPYVTSLEWRTATDLVVSTYGRGLWRLQGTFWIPEFGPLCRVVDCRIRYIDRGDPPPDIIRRGVVIFDGRVQGVRQVQGRVVEVFVSPGSSVGYIAEPGQAPAIRITESRRSMGLKGTALRLSTGPTREARIVALALDERGGLQGVAEARTELASSTPTNASASDDGLKPIDSADDPQASKASPAEAGPYLRLQVPGGRPDKLVRGAPIGLQGQGFEPQTTLVVLLDGEPVEKRVADDKGRIATTLKAPPTLGAHQVTLRDARSDQVLDGVTLNVTRGVVEEGVQDGRPGRHDKREEQGDEEERAGKRLKLRPPVRGR